MVEKRFVGHKLKEALCYRAVTMSALAKEISVSKQALSLYANDENIPSFVVVKEIADKLNFPLDFFFTDDDDRIDFGAVYFRSMSSAGKRIRESMRLRLNLVGRVYSILEEYLNFPKLNIISSVDIDSGVISGQSPETLAEIEKVANDLRGYWKLGYGPIQNLQYVLESNGIIVTGIKWNPIDISTRTKTLEMSRDKVDAFSSEAVINGKKRCLMAMINEVKPKNRLNFDMAHELGHLLLHQSTEDIDLLSRDEFSVKEKQANYFAGAFLLPRDSFMRDLGQYKADVNYYFTLRDKWKVSAQAMMYRARQLGAIDNSQYLRMQKTLSRRQLRKCEPGDEPSSIDKNIFQLALELLFKNNIFSIESFFELLQQHGLAIGPSNLEDVLGLRPGTLSFKNNVEPILSLKPLVNN